MPRVSPRIPLLVVLFVTALTLGYALGRTQAPPHKPRQHYYGSVPAPASLRGEPVVPEEDEPDDLVPDLLLAWEPFHPLDPPLAPGRREARGPTSRPYPPTNHPLRC